MNLRAGLDDLKKRKFLTLLGLELQPLGRVACSQSLYRLSYPGSLWSLTQSFKTRGEIVFEGYSGNSIHGLI
jgi:hypothetical protein